MHCRKVSALYIWLLPLARAVKYREVCCKQKAAISYRCRSQKGSRIKTYPSSFRDAKHLFRMETISASEKQSRNWLIQTASKPVGNFTCSSRIFVGKKDTRSIRPRSVILAFAIFSCPGRSMRVIWISAEYFVEAMAHFPVLPPISSNFLVPLLYTFGKTR